VSRSASPTRRAGKARAHLEVPPERTVLVGIGDVRLVGDRDEVAELREVDEREIFGEIVRKVEGDVLGGVRL